MRVGLPYESKGEEAPGPVFEGYLNHDFVEVVNGRIIIEA